MRCSRGRSPDRTRTSTGSSRGASSSCGWLRRGGSASSFETWGDAAPGEPFYLFGQNGDLKLDLGVADEEDGHDVVRIHKLYFDVGGEEAPAGYQFRLPDDTFEHPPVKVDGVAIHAASPLALYQLRAGIAKHGSFGELTERQLAALRMLRGRFFPDRSGDELDPPSERLPI